MPAPLSLATFAGGCFWCTEAAFEQLTGVTSVLPGYMGGHDPAPSYEALCRGDTGHAEVVQLRFDPTLISYEKLLEVFFTVHDPTTLNRQGNDVGTQYRSAIFYHDESQRATAHSVMERLTQAAVYSAPIVTEISPASTFFVAEPYHHQYFRNNPWQGYCQFVVAHKAEKTRLVFADLLKPEFRSPSR